MISTKSEEDQFYDWHSNAFPYGYGAGESHTLPAVKKFFALCRHDDSRESEYSTPKYDFRELETELGPVVAWMLINCMPIKYGVSPRFGWLNVAGRNLKRFFDNHSEDQLYEIATGKDENYLACYPDCCCCGPSGKQEERKCPNPFWQDD